MGRPCRIGSSQTIGGGKAHEVADRFIGAVEAIRQRIPSGAYLELWLATLMEAHATAFDRYFRYQMITFQFRDGVPMRQHKDLPRSKIRAYLVGSPDRADVDRVDQALAFPAGFVVFAHALLDKGLHLTR